MRGYVIYIKVLSHGESGYYRCETVDKISDGLKIRWKFETSTLADAKMWDNLQEATERYQTLAQDFLECKPMILAVNVKRNGKRDVLYAVL